jgi:hypothetical protein
MSIIGPLVKILFFGLWAQPTYKLTVEMYEASERRLGILPTDDGNHDGTERQSIARAGQDCEIDKVRSD